MHGGRDAIYNAIIDGGVAHEINGVFFNSLYLTRLRLCQKSPNTIMCLYFTCCVWSRRVLIFSVVMWVVGLVI